MTPLPTLDDLKDKGINKPRVKKPELETTRARTTKKKVEDDIDERDYEINRETDQKEKSELLDTLFSENEDIDFEKILRKEVMSVAAKKGTTSTRTGQPLKRVREGMEDVYTTLQLKELIDDFRKKKDNRTTEDDDTESNDMSYMLPFLQKMQNGGGNVGNIDPTLLMMLMGNQGNKGSSGLNQIMMMMMLMNAGTQTQQQDASGNPVYRNGINPENMKVLMEQLQGIMKQQEKPTIDPTVMLMLQMMNKQSQNQPQQNSMRDIATLITALKSTETPNNTPNMLLEMMKQNMELQNQRVISMIPNEAPEERVMRNFGFFKDIMGDKRERTDSEMDFSLRKQQMLLDEQQRMDMLDREERAQAREDAKGDRTLSLINTVADKVIGNGLGQLVGDLVSARGKGGKKTAPPDVEEFDASILDDF